MMKIEDLKNVNWGKSLAKATFTLISGEGIKIRGCLLKEGQYGFFVDPPSHLLKEPWTDKNGKEQTYGSDISFWDTPGLKEEIVKLASAQFDPAGITTGNTAAAMPM